MREIASLAGWPAAATGYAPLRAQLRAVTQGSCGTGPPLQAVRSLIGAGEPPAGDRATASRGLIYRARLRHARGRLHQREGRLASVPAPGSKPWMVVAPEATAGTLLELCFVYVSSERARKLPRLQDLACEIALRPFASLSVR